VVVAVAVVHMVQVTSDDVVDVIAVNDGDVPATGAVGVTVVMPFAPMWQTTGGVEHRDRAPTMVAEVRHWRISCRRIDVWPDQKIYRFREVPDVAIRWYVARSLAGRRN
jgi:hypothetical protein